MKRNDGFDEKPLFPNIKMPVNMLREMLDIQKGFQIKNDYNEPIHLLASAIMTEAGELWAISGGKWWKKYLKDYDFTFGHLQSIYREKFFRDVEKQNRAKIIEESIDVLHFLLCVWVRLGLKAEEVFESYKAKMGVNQERQNTNY